jgi:WD40 repeat protein
MIPSDDQKNIYIYICVNIKRTARSLVLVLAAVVLVAASARTAEPLSEDGFQPIFDGRSFAGWQVEGSETEHWSIADGCIVAAGNDYRTRGYLITDRDYADFVLRLEFNLDPQAGSAIAIRGVVGERMPLQNRSSIFDHPLFKLIDSPNPQQTGTCHWIKADGSVGMNLKPDQAAMLNPAGSWNTLELEVRGRSLRASVNGKRVLDATTDAGATLDGGLHPALDRKQGRIGLQKHTGTVRFRNIRVKHLAAQAVAVLADVSRRLPPPSSDESGYHPIFNGQDLSGWMVDGGDGEGWRVENGEIVTVGTGFETSNFLLSDRDYRYYSLRFEFTVGENANSGVAVRALVGERVNGVPKPLEVQIHDDESLGPGQGQPTGSLFWSHGGPMKRPTWQTPLKPRGQWNTMQVDAKGRRILAAVNGQYVLNGDLQPLLMDSRVDPAAARDEGRIGLQRHTGEVRFRNIRIKEETPPPMVVLDAGGHNGTVRGAVFTPDGRQVITASHDKTVRIWDVNTGLCARVIRPPTGTGIVGELYTVALSPDAKTLATGGTYGRIFLIDLPSGRMLHFLPGHSNSVVGLDFSPDGRSLASASMDKTVRIWDVSSGKTVRTLTGHTNAVRAVRFSPDGRKIATASTDKSARVFTADDGRLVTTITTNGQTSDVDWSQNGQCVITGDAVYEGSRSRGSVSVWRLDGALVKRHEIDKAVMAIRTAGPSSVLCVRGNRAIIIDLDNGQTKTTFSQSNNDLDHGAISPDGQIAVSTGFDGADIRLWRTADGQQLHQLRAAGNVKWSAGWSDDGTTIAWGNAPYRDRPLHLNTMAPLTHSFDLKALQVGQPSREMKPGSLELEGLQIAKNGPTTLLIKRGQSVVRTIDTRPLGGEWRSAAWFDNDHLLVGSNAGRVTLVDANTGTPKRNYIGHVGTIWAIAPSPDRRFILTASQDSTMRIWAPDSSAPLLTLYVSNDGEWIAWMGHGYYAASPAGERLMGWQVSQGLNSMPDFYPAAQFRKALYRPDVIARLIDAGSADKALAVANLAAGKSADQADLAAILPPKVSITSPALSPVQLTSGTLDVAAVAQSSAANPVTAMRVLIDGRPVPEGTTSFAKPITGAAKGSWTIEVPPGTHRLTVAADGTASKALSDSLEVVVAGDDGKPVGRLFLVIVGINDYMFMSQRSKLDCAVPDAQAIDQSFRKLSKPLFRSIESRMLLDRQATRANVLEALGWLKQSARPGDKAVFFYAGHGDNKVTGQFFLLPADVKVDNLAATGISDDDLKSAIGELPCSALLMLDACYAGSFGQKRRKTRSIAKPSDGLASEMINDFGLALLCGAKANQEANEEGGHGFFTQAITEGLAGAADLDKDGVVELYELLPFVKSKVTKLSAGDQVPTAGLPPSVDSFALSKP